ncbi:acyl-CoA dehydrogenase [Sphingomonas colocasiae]|uniref:Acyl-CoA dehydrogenase/oxidase C-terminal domain-containing protein n=1 Tax=Sphingomonas colocasiae TaxID=1848973 RepID=A0ABS7PTC0_9SPHN|nr:acyl-CoA dehydrogenase [Sphingomonas colocasiae]MBY8823920.1 hypothetical protein [Sphingomonas colocasiae]
MDLAFDDTQAAIKDSCERLFARHAGPARARDLRRDNGCDRALVQALEGDGFADLFGADGAGPLTAALVVEWAGEAAALAPIGNRLLVAPALLAETPPTMVAVADADRLDAVRFAADADLLIVIDGDEVRVAARGDFAAVPVKSKFGYPFAQVSDVRGTPLAPGSGAVARRWRQVAIAAEIAGTARAALDLTTRYLRERLQFGKAIATFQAVQHRIAELHVSVDSAEWAVREAAWHHARADLAAAAALTACEAAQRAFQETHQLTGAMGFTIEYDLHLWTMRLQALRHEGGGPRAHARDLVRARWKENG